MLLVKLEKSFWKRLRIYCAFSVFILFRKNRYHQQSLRQEKCHFHCPASHITFHSKFVFLTYRLCQYTHPGSAACALMPWVFKKLPKYKAEPVHVQEGYCGRGVQAIETPLYELLTWQAIQKPDVFAFYSADIHPSSSPFCRFDVNIILVIWG